MVATERSERILNELDRAISTLKTEDRTLIQLFYFENRSLPEISPIQEALKMRLSRVRDSYGKYSTSLIMNEQPDVLSGAGRDDAVDGKFGR